MNSFSRLKALLPALQRVEMLPRVDDRSLTVLLTFQTGDFIALVTDFDGDGLYFAPPYIDGVSYPLSDSLRVYDSRDFSVHKYDLHDDADCRAARSYVRRKLLALIDSDSDISSSAEKSDTVSVLHDSTLTSVTAVTLRKRGFQNSLPDAPATEGDRGDVAPGNQCLGTESPALRDYEPL